MKNQEISALRTRVERGKLLGKEEQQLSVLQELLKAKRRLLKAKAAGYLPKEKQEKQE